MRKLWLLSALLLAPAVHATVTGTASTVPFTCTNSTGPFAFTFPVDDVGGLLVVEQLPGSNPGVYTILPSAQWNGTPVNNSYANGGTITLVSPCPSGNTLTIVRATEPTQQTHFTPNMPALYANFENSLDKLTTGRQDTFRVDQVHIGTLATLSPGNAGTANMTYTPLGQFLNINFPTASTAGTGLPPGYLPINLLSCSTSINTIPVDVNGVPNCASDASVAINNCFANNFSATTPVTIYAPPGCYLIDHSTSLLIGGTFESHLIGDKLASIFRAGPSLSGKPILLHEDNYQGIVEGINFQGTAASPPSAAIESKVACPIANGGDCTGLVTVLTWPQNKPTFSHLTIGSLQPSGGFSNGLTNGIIFDHDLSGCGFGGNNSCDGNNDQAWMIDNDIHVTQWGYEFVGGNEEEHKIIGGQISGGTECIRNVGGSFQFNPTSVSCGIVLNEKIDSNPLDFPYLKPRSIVGGMGDVVHQLWITDASTGIGSTQQVSGEGSVDNFVCQLCGPTSSAGFWIDWESGSATGKSADFNYSNGQAASMGNGGIMKFTDPSSIVSISHLRATPNSIQFANSLHGDTINIPTPAFTGFIYTGSKTRDLSLLNWRVNGVQQVPVIDNLALAGGLFGYGSYNNLPLDSDWQLGNPSGGTNTHWADFGTTAGMSTNAQSGTDIFGYNNAMTITCGTLTGIQFCGVLSAVGEAISVNAGDTLTLKVSAKGSAGQNLLATIKTTDPNCASTGAGGGQILVTLGTAFPSAPYSNNCTFAANGTAQVFVGSQTSGGTITVSHVELTKASGAQLPVITTTSALSGTGVVVAGRALPAPIAVGSPVAFASLSACSAALEGTTASIKDSATVTWGATITGGSTNHVLGYCDGSAWTVTGK